MEPQIKLLALETLVRALLAANPEWTKQIIESFKVQEPNGDNVIPLRYSAGEAGRDLVFQEAVRIAEESLASVHREGD